MQDRLLLKECQSENIKENGLDHPLLVAVIDGETVPVDGRNRREACRMAGLTPRHELIDAEDAISCVLEANVHRRHLPKGQRAMAVAVIHTPAPPHARLS